MNLYADENKNSTVQKCAVLFFYLQKVRIYSRIYVMDNAVFQKEHLKILYSIAITKFGGIYA